MAEIAQRVEQLCILLEDEDDVWDSVDQAGVRQVLQQIVAAINAGDHDDALRAHLDVLDTAMDADGFGEITHPSRPREYRPLTGTGAGHPIVHAWTCPAPTPCTRVHPTIPQGQQPVCAMTGHALTRVRIST